MRKRWIIAIVCAVLVVGFVGGAIFAYAGGPAKALTNIDDAITDMIGKFTGGGDVVINPNDLADQVKLDSLISISDFKYEFKRYNSDSDFAKNNILGSVNFKMTNLSQKTIKSISSRIKVYFRGEIIKTQEGTDAARSIASQETSKKFYGFDVRISDLGDWKLEEFSAEVEITKIDY